MIDGYPKSFKPSPFSEKSRKKRASERRRRMFVGWPLAILSAIAFVLILVTLVAYMPQFYIERITVSGLRLVAHEEVEALIDKKRGTLYRWCRRRPDPISDASIRQYGEEDRRDAAARPFGESTISFPSEIRVAIVEKTEILAVRVSGGFALLDSGLNVIRIAGERDFDIPVLEGIRTKYTGNQ